MPWLGIRGLWRSVAPAVLVMISVLSMSACRKPTDAGKADLAQAGYELTQADWFRAVRENNLPVMKRFLDAGFDWQAADESGDHALHEAAKVGAAEAAAFLLERGKLVDLPGAQGRTPLMAAAIGNQRSMVRWFVKQGADVTRKDASGYTALMLAVREGKPGAVDELAALERDALDPALLLAALMGREEVIDSLTNYGASVYARMEDGRTPLMIAAENGHAGAVRLLLDIGAGRHATDENGLTAADHASANGYHEIVAMLRNESPDDALAIAGLDVLGSEMNQTVENARIDGAQGEVPGTVKASAHATSRVAVSPLSGAVFGATPSPAEASSSGSATGAPSVPPLVMRSYQERELPVRVVSVENGKAKLEIRGKTAEQTVVAAGQTIPGSRLVVIRAERRMRESKLNLGQPMEVSVVEVRDPSTGATREWISGHPATAHDPVALVEDASTGRRYVASPGQRFKSADGAEFIVSDVRPNQIVIEDASSGEVVTLPLRGPRG